MNQELLFFFSALGAFNGLLVGLYFLFFAKPKKLPNRLLGALFLALSVRVGKSVFFYFYDYIADGYIQFGLFACWLIGPFLYYYIRSVITPKMLFYKEVLIVLLSLSSLSILINFIFSWSSYPALWDTFIRIIYLQWLIFVVLSGWVLYKNRSIWFFQNKNKPFKIWILSVFLGNLLICLAFNTGNYTSYIVGALSFSFVFYTLILLLLFYKRRDELLSLETKKYQSNKLAKTEAMSIKTALDAIVITNNLCLDSTLSLKKVAEILKVPSFKISQTLNEYYDTNFNEYVNAHRIAEASKRIIEEPNLTFEAIAMDCGYNSKSTFYTAFKKQLKMTPSQFKSTHLANE